MQDINLIQIILVTLVAFVAGMASVLDERQFHRPLVACTLTGIAMGNPTVGIMVGGSLELIALGWMNVGAAMAPDSALASGDTVKNALEMIPKVITDGLNIAGGFIVVVGYAMVINMMKARKLMPFFFLGFIFATFATTVGGSASVGDHSKGIDKWVINLAPNGATLVALGILGACLAVIYVQLNPEFHDSVRLPAAASPAASGGSSSDLDDDLDDELD